MYCNLGEVRMDGEGRFHLEVGDVLAMPAQVVFFVVDEIEEVVIIEFADVASVESHVVHQLEGIRGTVPVALEHDVRSQWTQHDFTGGIGW